MAAIADITAREILDSRGNPTIEVDVVLEAAPSAARRCRPAPRPARMRRWSCATATSPAIGGKGVLTAVANVEGEILEAVGGIEATEQVEIDNIMIDLDGTPNKARLGANAILGVSLAVAKAAAADLGLPLYRYVGGVYARTLPVPMMNILNGGKHADNPIDIQEFMIMPIGAATLADAVRMGSEVFQTLKKGLHDAGHNTNVGDEGGFAPEPEIGRRSAGLHRESLREGRLPAWRGRHASRSIRASSEFFKDGRYHLEGEGKMLDAEGMVRYYADLVSRYPIVSIEDGCAEDDWDAWKLLTEPLGGKIQTGRRRYVRHQPRAPAPRHRRRVGQCDPDQGQPDRHAVRDAGDGGNRPSRRLDRGHEPPLGRDRGLHHRRPRGGHELRADQDRQPGAQRPDLRNTTS